MGLIGRDLEQREVAERLSERRLVTLIGPAGVGKTAIAGEVAAQVASMGGMRSLFVDLTRVDASSSVSGAIAKKFGSASLDDLIGWLDEQPSLIVVDNCEHVISPAAEAIDELLQASPTSTVLATSRSPLGLPTESLILLAPLAVPTEGDVAEACDSVRLFLDRARDAGANLGPDQVATVAELCRRLDGLPLAIELAAARTRVLRPSEILERLAAGTDLLDRRRFRGDARHRSLAATLDWSYRLLPDAVGALFERLGLLAGPFTSELAGSIAADVGLDAAAAVDALELLVDSSLVIAEPTADAMHFRLLHTMRTFARARLTERGELEKARRQLAEHVVALATDLLLSTGGTRWDPASFRRLLALHDTIAAELRWCLAHDAEPERALMLCSVPWGVVHQGNTDEVHALAEATIERWPDPTLPFGADAIATAATARCLVGDPEGGLALAEQALAHADGSRTAPVTLRRAMAYSARALNDPVRAMELLTEVSDLARRSALLALALEADVTRAQLLADDNDLEAALSLARSARREARAVGSTVNEVWAQTVEAHLELRRDIPTGLPLVHDALQAARRIGYPIGISANLRSLAWAATRTGDLIAGATALEELYDDLVARGGVADVRSALQVTAELLHVAGDPAWRSIAATAETLPLVGLMSRSVDDPSSLPSVDGVAPLPRREAVAQARRALRRILDPAVDTPAPEPEPTSPGRRGRIVDHGAFWEIDFAGQSISAKASKGLADIARLLTAPGTEIHCLDLIGAAVQESSLGDTIDEAARREYEQRIRDLQADVDVAEADNDYARAERAQVELDALVEHLAAALGLGRRARAVGGSAERARSAVTQRIRSAMRRLGADHPPLGRHLEASLATGIYCCYRPEQPVDWER